MKERKLLFYYQGISMLKNIIIIFILFFSTNGYAQPKAEPTPTQNTNNSNARSNLTPAIRNIGQGMGTSGVSGGVSAKTNNFQQARVQANNNNTPSPKVPKPTQNNDTATTRKRRRKKQEEEVKKKSKRGSSSFPMRYSYSGADCKAVAFHEGGGETINLESLATISYSVYEAKSPVRRLGERGVAGYTKGIRTIAGSMVFLVVEDHPLAKLVEASNLSSMWSKDLEGSESKGYSNQDIQGSKRYLSTMLKPFNIGLYYRTEVSFIDNTESYEYSTGYISEFNEMAQLVIQGVEIISEGMVTSVNDMVTEITMQFVAHDVFNIEKKVDSKIEISTKKEGPMGPPQVESPQSNAQPQVVAATSTNTSTPVLVGGDFTLSDMTVESISRLVKMRVSDEL